VGTGLAFYEMVNKNPDGTNIGIDISDGMLQKARQRLSKLPGAGYALKLGSAFNIQEADAQFDLIMNNYMFDLITFDEMDIVLKEFKRVLKKDGKLVLVNMTVGEKFGSGIYDLMYRLSPKMMGGCRGIRMSEKLSQHGFQIKLREYYQQLLFPSEVILAQK
jgi:ubiquinone/menaquinone biosynthesis C-methylase UbiE